MKLFCPISRRAAHPPCIECLESRIAPASVLLNPGDGPFTLELDPFDSHLHITNGVSAEIFDQGGPVGDDLLVTGGGSTDTFTIIQTAAGNVSFTGALDVNISGAINVNGPVTTGTDLALTTGEFITQTAIVTLTNSTVHYTAAKSVIFNSASLSTGGGSIFINGNQQAIAATGGFAGIAVFDTPISSSTGDITLKGRGGDSSAGFQYGIIVQSNGSVGNGTSGAVSIEGTGGAGTGGDNHGVLIDAGTITAGAGGSVEVTGFGGTSATTPFNVGVFVLGPGLITSTDGDVMVTGTGGGTASSGQNYGVYSDNGVISAGGNGKVVVTGRGGAGSAGGHAGVLILNSTARIAGNGGPVSVIGTGGASSSGNSDGVYVANGAEIKTVGNGTLDVTGQGGASGPNNYGVFVQNSNSKIRTALGNMMVTGVGGSGTDLDQGVRLEGGGELLAEGGVMTVQGTGGAGSSGTNNNGLDFDATSKVTSTAGNVALIGDGGGTGAASFGRGISTVATILIMGSGNLTLTGTGAAVDGPGNLGVSNQGSISTVAGSITVTGFGGGTAASDANAGVNLEGTIAAGGTGTISITGRSGPGKTLNFGVSFQSGGSLQTVDGDITVLGLLGKGKGGAGVDLSATPGATIRTLGAGNIEIASNELNINPGANINAGPNTVSLHPATPGTRISLGLPDKLGVLALTDAELDRVTAGRLEIGDNTSGTVLVRAPITRAASTTLALFSGARMVNIEAGLDTAGGTLLFSDGTYFLRGSNLIADTTSINVHAATFNLGLSNDTVQAVTVDHGSILGTGTLTSATAFNVLSGRINAQLGGAVGLVKSSPDTAILGNPNNTFTGTVAINAGILQVAGDGAFGAAANDLAINNATLRTTATFTSPRAINFSGPATLDVVFATTLTLSGAVTGAGPLTQTGGGTLIIGNAYPFTVDNTSTTMMGGGTVPVDGASVTLGGGTLVVQTGPAGSHFIESIEVSDSTSKTSLSVTSPAGTVTQIAKIISANAMDSIGKIVLGKGVMFGDGLAGVASDPTEPDLAVAGKLGKLLLDAVGANTLVTLGKGLPYNANPANPGDSTPDTYNQKPELKISQIMGPGVTFDLTPLRDNMGAYIRDEFGNYVGGGGLGKVTIGEWGANGTRFPGLIKTTQSITSFTLKNGDCGVTFEVDKEGVGATTPGNVGAIKVLNGSWTSTGNVIDGYVGLFDVGGFTAGADLQADYIQKKFLVRGTFTDINGVAYGGTTTLDQDVASGAFNISVGDFTGKIAATGPIGKFTANGTFSGSLTAKSIASVTADEFLKIGLTGPLIKSTGGAIGAVTTKFGGIANTTIESSTNIGKIISKGPLTGSKILATGTIDAMTFSYGPIATSVMTPVPPDPSAPLITLQGFKTATVGLKVGTAPTILNASLPGPGHYYFKFLDAANTPLGTIHILKL